MNLVLLHVCFLASISVFGQPADSLKNSEIKDSVNMGFVAKMHAFARTSAEKSAAELAAEKADLEQKQILEAAKKSLLKAKTYLKTSVVNLVDKAALAEVKTNLALAEDGIFTNKGTAQTFRNLTASGNILHELQIKATTWQIRLDAHQKALKNFRYQADSILNSPVLFRFPADSTELSHYLADLIAISKETRPVSERLDSVTKNTEALLAEVNQLTFKIQSDIDEIEVYQAQMGRDAFARDFNNLWEPVGYTRPFTELLAYSVKKGVLTFAFYLEDNVGKIFAMFLLMIGCTFYLRSLKKIYDENKLLRQDWEGQLVLRYPALSAVLIVLSLTQFVFIHIPFLVSVCFWVASCICLTIVFSKFISSYWMRVWLAMTFLFLIAALDNLILQASRPERWLMLVNAIAGIVVGTIALVKRKERELKEQWIIYSIMLMILFELGAVLANAFGRYNLSKTLLISGFTNVIICILFLWTVRLINEGLFLAFAVYKKQDRKLLYLNSRRVGKKAPRFFYVLLMIGWLVLVGKNSPSFEILVNPLKGFFTRERTLGEYTFSIDNLVLFIAIMAVSVIVSKIVSFFASDRHLASDKGEREGIGSWLLLVRISILSIGLFLAVAAAGIPLEKIAIVLGALGVGIGFGLQSLVNNLVSGLIIAFEKPVNVGDVVDIDGQAGTMKSIGFRSSVITTWEGADVVMPNGHLLDSHLINWSLGGNRKRLTIVVGIAYNTDLERAKSILQEILSNDDRIIKNPQPIVQFEQFSSGAIDLRIYFWTTHMKDAGQTLSDLIIRINNAFLQAGISVPVPQREVYLHNPPSEGT